MAEHIPYYQHHLGAAEIASVTQALSDPILTTGAYVEQFEKEFSNYLGCRQAVGLMSGTAALHLALSALGVGAGDEVITTPLSYVATATAILNAGASPVFVDVDPETGNIDPNRIDGAITPRTRAILPVHLYGQLCDMKAIQAIAGRHNLVVIEDCAHALESRREDYGCGMLSDAACFSFYATKNITCGEGGALVSNDHTLAKRVKMLSHHGIEALAKDLARDGYHPRDMRELGWKYNMSNIQAALLLPQLPMIGQRLSQREQLWAMYNDLFASVSEISAPRELQNARHSHHLYTIWLDEQRDRDAFVDELFRRHIMVTVNYPPIHLFTYFRKAFGYKQGDFPHAEKIGRRTVSLPFYPSMPKKHLSIVAETITDVIRG
ncbi:MAG: DegT/DnrJ/EryC1/StrS family aminotransferase [Rhodospirillales bacterium]|nr:DegT/DnrJ/EryC1/StrS family aminotransferase [Rhodospirillales bacterium]